MDADSWKLPCELKYNAVANSVGEMVVEFCFFDWLRKKKRERMISCPYLEPRSLSLLCLMAVLTELSFTVVLKSSGGSSHTFQRTVVVLSEETAEPSDWFGYWNNSDSEP